MGFLAEWHNPWLLALLACFHFILLHVLTCYESSWKRYRLHRHTSEAVRIDGLRCGNDLLHYQFFGTNHSLFSAFGLRHLPCDFVLHRKSGWRGKANFTRCWLVTVQLLVHVHYYFCNFLRDDSPEEHLDLQQNKLLWRRFHLNHNYLHMWSRLLLYDKHKLHEQLKQVRWLSRLEGSWSKSHLPVLHRTLPDTFRTAYGHPRWWILLPQHRIVSLPKRTQPRKQCSWRLSRICGHASHIHSLRRTRLLWLYGKHFRKAIW